MTITVGSEYAGVAVEVWMYSTPVKIGTGTIDASGRISVTIPADAATGTHRLVVYAATGEILGWTSIRIVADGTLAQTGSDEEGTTLAIALLLMLAGLVAIVSRRRTRASD